MDDQLIFSTGIEIFFDSPFVVQLFIFLFFSFLNDYIRSFSSFGVILFSLLPHCFYDRRVVVVFVARALFFLFNFFFFFFASCSLYIGKERKERRRGRRRYERQQNPRSTLASTFKEERVSLE